MSETPASFFTNLPPWPQVDFAAFGAIEVKPLSKIQKLTGAFLSRNWLSIPHVTHQDAADVTDLETLRKAPGPNATTAKVTPLAFLVKASVLALKAHPAFNASLDASANTVVLKKYFNIGIAVDTPAGLLVPVLRHCDSKSVVQIAEEIAAVSSKARLKGLSLTEMSGGCFSISSLGAIGGTGFTPIINARSRYSRHHEVAMGADARRRRWHTMETDDAALVVVRSSDNQWSGCSTFCAVRRRCIEGSGAAAMIEQVSYDARRSTQAGENE